MICEEKIKRCLTPNEKSIILAMELFKIKGHSYIKCSTISSFLCIDLSNIHKSIIKLEERGILLTLKNKNCKEIIL